MLTLCQQGKTGEHGEESLGAEYVTKIPVKIGVLSVNEFGNLGIPVAQCWYKWLPSSEGARVEASK